MQYENKNNTMDQVMIELKELDKLCFEVDGIKMKPSHCYHYSFNPFHILFNTNCPEAVRKKVIAVFNKYGLKT